MSPSHLSCCVVISLSFPPKCSTHVNSMQTMKRTPTLPHRPPNRILCRQNVLRPYPRLSGFLLHQMRILPYCNIFDPARVADWLLRLLIKNLVSTWPSVLLSGWIVHVVPLQRRYWLVLLGAVLHVLQGLTVCVWLPRDRQSEVLVLHHVGRSHDLSFLLQMYRSCR